MGTIARLNTAKKKLAQAEQAMPGAYQNNYTDSINQKLVQLADASLTGSTGVDTDALNAAYQQYRANSVANAQNRRGGRCRHGQCPGGRVRCGLGQDRGEPGGRGADRRRGQQSEQPAGGRFAELEAEDE